MVSAEALGEKGREVRCGKCTHRWFQEPPRDSLDELQSLVEKISDDDSKDIAKSIKPESKQFDSPEIKLNRSPKEILKESKKKTVLDQCIMFYSQQEKVIAGFMLALAIAALITLGILSITNSWSVPKKSPFMIDGLRTEQQQNGDDLSGSFRVINLSDKQQTLPRFKVILLSDQQRILAVKELDKKQDLEPETHTKFEFTFKDVPSVAHKIKVISFE
jgi:hypothetical protein